MLLWHGVSYQCFGDFVPGQFHHCKISLPQGADDLVEAHLQGSPPLGRSWLSPLAVLSHDHHAAATVTVLGTALGKNLHRQKYI